MSYKLEQSQGRLKALEGKCKKLEESGNRVRMEMGEAIERGREELEMVVVEKNQRERQLNGEIYQERLKVER